MGVNSITIHIPVTLSSMEITVPVDIGQTIPAPAAYYHGEYEVNPDFDGAVLDTKHKYMSEDVTINPIRVDVVSNLSGGNTVYIGGAIVYGE